MSNKNFELWSLICYIILNLPYVKVVLYENICFPWKISYLFWIKILCSFITECVNRVYFYTLWFTEKDWISIGIRRNHIHVYSRRTTLLLCVFLRCYFLILFVLHLLLSNNCVSVEGTPNTSNGFWRLWYMP